MIQNDHGEKLVGILHDTGSDELVIVCHGFQSSKVLYLRLFLYGFESVLSCGISNYLFVCFDSHDSSVFHFYSENHLRMAFKSLVKLKCAIDFISKRNHLTCTT